MYDVFFLSHGEPNAPQNLAVLQKYVPYAKCVADIDGIHEAHRQCAIQSNTPMFYVVDADAEVLPDFFWSFMPLGDERKYTHIWRARNAVNKLVYGHGGIKLFPRMAVRDAHKVMPLDFSMTVASVKLMPQIGSINRFDSTPYQSWKGAFRECAKLAKQNTKEARYRLKTWCTIGTNAECLRGAQEGRLWSRNNQDIRLINDPNFLEQFYVRRYLDEF